MKVGFLLPELLKNLFKKPETTKYPFEASPVQVGFRGYPEFSSDKCIGCKRCENDCPAEAIFMIQTNEAEKPKDRKFKMKLYKDRCIRCGQCVYACPVQALKMNEEYETARFDRAGYLIEEE
ncbi:MAG TPA: 4Fe-4S binding protein [bacterium]|nr:4Fe-4S binding protein [bacterium]